VDHSLRVLGRMSTAQFGGWLRHARESRGLSVEAIARLTKIPARHVEALERGDASPLPAFYQRAEVRAVARVVGVDEQLAVDRLEAELPHIAAPRRAPVPPEPPEPSEPRTVRLDHLLAIVGMGMLVAWLTGWGPFQRTAASGGPVATHVQTPELVTAPPAAPLPSEVQTAPPAVPPAPTSGSAAASHAAPTAAIAPAASVAAAESPASSAPGYPTELVIRTEPEGARVTVNGIGWGESPITIQHIEPGEQHIRVTMDGFIASERSVVIDEGRQQAVNIGLNPQ